MKVAVAQFEITPGNTEKNFNKGLAFIGEAIKKQCRLILLPEVWTTGFLFKKLKNLSAQTPEILEELKKISKDICICGSYVIDDKSSDKVFNIFYAIDKGKIIFEYKKTMLFATTGEDKFFIPGDINQKNTFTLEDITIGVSTCYELRFPEFFRKSAFRRALIHLHPAIWPVNRLNHWLTLTAARAIENQYFLLTANGTKKRQMGACRLFFSYQSMG